MSKPEPTPIRRGISFEELVERRRTFAIPFVNGATLEVTYRPDAITPANAARLDEAIEDDDPLAIAKIIASALTEWELTGPFALGTDAEVAAGEPVPVDADHLAHLPGPYLFHIWKQIVEDANPDPKARRKSSTSRR